MIDREKVIKGLAIHADRSDDTDCEDCPYSVDDFSIRTCIGQLCADVLVLLKEQEAEWLEVDDKHDAFDCSNCGAMAGRKCLYCPGCGAKMKNGTRAMQGR